MIDAMAGTLASVHNMLAGTVDALRPLATSKEEALLLAEAMANVADLHNAGVDPRAMIYAHAALMFGAFYGPKMLEILAINRMRAAGNGQAATA